MVTSDFFYVNNQITQQLSELCDAETFRKLLPVWILDFISSRHLLTY